MELLPLSHQRFMKLGQGKVGSPQLSELLIDNDDFALHSQALRKLSPSGMTGRFLTHLLRTFVITLYSLPKLEDSLPYGVW